MVERDDQHLAAGRRFDVGDDAKVRPDQEALALGEVVEGDVVGAVRTCDLRGGITIQERWLAWDEGRSFVYEE